MKTEPCILVSTCEKYRDLAEFTASRIDHAWPRHPAVYFCGLAGDGGRFLPLRDDPADWMRVTRSACASLGELGYEIAYVVLDDHPPVGACHVEHLNTTIPALMARLDAICIALSGYNQGRKPYGRIVRAGRHRLDHCPPDELWKFSLHPALWNLGALRRILDALIETLPDAQHTPWAFERKGGAPDAELPHELKARSFRIDGLEFAAGPYPRGLRTLRFATDVLRFLMRKLGGAAAREAIDERVLGIHHYYHGPYPLIWSGLMRKGAINPDAQYFLKLAGRRDVLESLPAIARR